MTPKRCDAGNWKADRKEDQTCGEKWGNKVKVGFTEFFCTNVRLV